MRTSGRPRVVQAEQRPAFDLGLDAAAAERAGLGAVGVDEHRGAGLLRRAAARLDDGAVHARPPPGERGRQFGEQFTHGYSAIVTPTTTRLKPRKDFSPPAVTGTR